MKKWESKKQLRKRIAQLEGALSVTGPSVHIVEKDITNVCYSVDIEDRVPAEFIKEDIARRLGSMLLPHIHWDISRNMISGRNKITGMIKVVIDK